MSTCVPLTSTFGRDLPDREMPSASYRPRIAAANSAASAACARVVACTCADDIAVFRALLLTSLQPCDKKHDNQMRRSFCKTEMN